jgi:hypothetical protein
VVKQDFSKKLQYFVLFRQLQTLGAYGFRGLIEKKLHFLQSIPFALENVKKLLCLTEFPQIFKILFNPKIAQISANYLYKHTEKLTIQIESFAFKNGIPQDYSGNGGGYVFDCRAIYNPGRFDEYKNLTGLDAPVKEFIENSTNINEFLKNVYLMIDRHIEVFLARKFTHLSVFFGCTGGQHRSVYCTESLAQHLQKYSVNICLKHRELGIIKNFAI